MPCSVPGFEGEGCIHYTVSALLLVLMSELVCTPTQFKVLSSTSKYSSIHATRRRTEFTISPSTVYVQNKMQSREWWQLLQNLTSSSGLPIGTTLSLPGRWASHTAASMTTLSSSFLRQMVEKLSSLWQCHSCPQNSLVCMCPLDGAKWVIIQAILVSLWLHCTWHSAPWLISFLSGIHWVWVSGLYSKCY
jgi:hypothetical protein